eukprot:6984187-Prymnesium_polylepis.1
MAAEELVQATRRSRWWSGAAASKSSTRRRAARFWQGPCGVPAKPEASPCDHTKVCFSASVLPKHCVEPLRHVVFCEDTSNIGCIE